MVKNGHDVNVEPAHVFGDGEGHVAQVVLMIEDGGVLELTSGPLDILRICHLVLLASKDSQREVKKAKVVSWWSWLAVVLLVLSCGFVVPSQELLVWEVNELSVVHNVSVGGTSRKI